MASLRAWPGAACPTLPLPHHLDVRDLPRTAANPKGWERSLLRWLLCY